MTQIATCSYREFDPAMGIPVRTSLGVPRWTLPYPHDFKKAWVWEITPRRDYLRASDAVYTERFYAQLEEAGVDGIRKKFERISAAMGAGTLVLLCFEDVRAKGWHSCHRRMFADWWKESTGEDVPEYGKNPERDHVHLPGGVSKMPPPAAPRPAAGGRPALQRTPSANTPMLLF